MGIRNSFVFTFALVILITSRIYSQEKPLKILFIGNSYVFFNDVPGKLKEIAKANGKEIYTKTVARNGASIEQHWNEDKALNGIKSDNWDYVVLQERSSLARGQTDKTLKIFKLFAEEIKKKDSNILLYVTPSYKGQLEIQKATYDSYKIIGKKIDAEVVPVGPIFQKVYSEIDDIKLHDPDKVHPGEKGSYLAAIVFYVSIFGELPEESIENTLINLTEFNTFKKLAKKFLLK